MVSNPDDYYNRYKFIFAKDFGYSRGFTKAANAIIMRNLVEIHDHEKRVTKQDELKDSQGADRTIKIPPFTCGLRVRRPKPFYIKCGDFTMDTKEWGNPKQPQYYIAGYGRKDNETFAFYMLWDHKQFMNLAKENRIKHGIEQNNEHSGVQFLTFKFKDVFDKCEILECGGDTEIIRQVLDERKVVQTQKLGEFV